jgi:peptidoglycan hydrolase-like protein with peptidoglycan-binding domain
VLGVATTSPLISSTAMFSRNLTMRSRGPDVKNLQQLLISRGFLRKGYDTGYFGILTQNALMRYQKVMKIIPATGYFGPMTRGLIQ